MSTLALPLPPSSSNRRTGLLATDDAASVMHSITIVGDLRMDVNVQLGAYDFGSECARYTCYRDVHVSPGGTALVMCRAFASHFDSRHVVSALGSDSYSESLRSAVHEVATGTTIREVDSPNGLTVALFRDSAGSVPKSRYSVASPKSPYLSLDQNWVNCNLASALSCDILTMDCLLLASPESIPVAHSIARAARLSNCLFAVDVVPHNLLDYVHRAEIARLLTGANLVTVELDTLAQMLNASSQPVATRAEAERLYRELRPCLARRHWVVIRFGALNIEHSVTFSSDGPSWDTDSGPEIRSGGYPSGSAISGLEYRFVVTQWKQERDTTATRHCGQ